MKKKIWIASAVVVAIIVLLCAALGAMSSRSLSISTGRFLRADSGTPMMVCGNSPISVSNQTGRDLFDGLETGDKILVVHDGIAESYPGQTGAYAVLRLKKGNIDDIPQGVIDSLRDLGWLESANTLQSQENVTVTDTTEPPAQTFTETTGVQSEPPAPNTSANEPTTSATEQTQTEPPISTTAAVTTAAPAPILPENLLDPQQYQVTVCYSNYYDAPAVFQKSVNARNKTDFNHPVFVFESAAELARFEQEFSGCFTFGQGYDEMPSFNDVKGTYDEAFFEGNAMILVYVESGSGSERFGIKEILFDDTSMLLHTEELNNPFVVTDDLAGWFLMVTLPRELISGITSFDASYARAD